MSGRSKRGRRLMRRRWIRRLALATLITCAAALALQATTTGLQLQIGWLHPNARGLATRGAP